jgi:hypothetical protein
MSEVSEERLAELIAGQERFAASGDIDWLLVTDEEELAVYRELQSLRAWRREAEKWMRHNEKCEDHPNGKCLCGLDAFLQEQP